MIMDSIGAGTAIAITNGHTKAMKAMNAKAMKPMKGEGDESYDSQDDESLCTVCSALWLPQHKLVRTIRSVTIRQLNRAIPG